MSKNYEYPFVEGPAIEYYQLEVVLPNVIPIYVSVVGTPVFVVETTMYVFKLVNSS